MLVRNVIYFMNFDQKILIKMEKKMREVSGWHIVGTYMYAKPLKQAVRVDKIGVFTMFNYMHLY